MKYCHNCGAQVDEPHRFCAQCGQNLSVALPAAPAARVRDYHRHVKLLAVLLLVWGGLGLLKGLVMMWAVGPLARFMDHIAGDVLPGMVLPALMTSWAWVFIGVAIAAIVAGVGLLDYESWARPLTIVVCVLALLRFPLGTLLGIYGLWVLVSGEGERHYRQVAASQG